MPDELHDIREDFRSRLDFRLVNILRDITAGNLNTARRELHNIKGSAAMLGFGALSLAAGTLETEIDNNSITEASMTVFRGAVQRIASI